MGESHTHATSSQAETDPEPANEPSEAQQLPQREVSSSPLPAAELGGPDKASLSDAPSHPLAGDSLSLREVGMHPLPSLSSPFGAAEPQEGPSNAAAADDPSHGLIQPATCVSTSKEETGADTKASPISIPAVHTSPKSGKSRGHLGGLGKLGRRLSGHGRLEGADLSSDQADAAPRTPSSSYSPEGSKRSRSSFTQSVAKLGQLGRGALENLQDLQTAAQRALSGELTFSTGSLNI